MNAIGWYKRFFLKSCSVWQQISYVFGFTGLLFMSRVMVNQSFLESGVIYTGVRLGLLLPVVRGLPNNAAATPQCQNRKPIK
jgi:hypothetical protein